MFGVKPCCVRAYPVRLYETLLKYRWYELIGLNIHQGTLSFFNFSISLVTFVPFVVFFFCLLLCVLWLDFMSILHAVREQRQACLAADAAAPVRVLPGEEMIFWMRHQPKHISLRVADAGDIGD